MTPQPFRTAAGGAIDRTRTLSFTFDGKPFQGHPGDTLASALLANGVRLVGRSFKYHRPRGIFTAGPEEPNALVALGAGARMEPNTRATVTEVFDGLTARSQNAWPTLDFDLAAATGWLAPLLPAGFYYKTFLGRSQVWTRLYEPMIRAMAGLGPAPVAPDPDRYDKRHAQCDVLVIGAGPAGLSAACAAGAGGARVMLLDERATPGGALLASRETIDGLPAPAWAGAAATFAAMPEATLLVRTTAFGRFDDNLVMAMERRSDHLAPGAPGPRQRLWQIRAKQILLAAGAHEQPLLFSNNDLPGIMLAHAGQTYARHFGVLAGRRVVVAANTAGGGEAARALAEAGAEIVALVDGRPEPEAGEWPVLPRAAIARALGTKALEGVEVARSGGERTMLACDALLVSGGWQPALHLHNHVNGRTRFDEALQCFVPDGVLAGVKSVGACAGRFALAECLADGHSAGSDAATEAGFPAHFRAPNAPPATSAARQAAWSGPVGAKSFVDLQNDVTAADIDLAHREGFTSVEHLKRYTTTGMATDQGKLSNLNALRRMSGHLGVSPGAMGVTGFRPPYTPVTFGALAGLERGDLMDPIRTTPMHEWHVRQGAVFEDVGQWKRPWYFPHAGETMEAAVRRECRAVRTSVGLLDASTLGKIDVQGPDAALFLNRIYTNAWLKLEIGRCRYGVMCTEDGMVLDDGVAVRLGPQRFIVFTTTGNAARVLDHLEDLLQTEWPDLTVFLTSVTDHWAASVVTGPNARAVLGQVLEGADLSPEAFAHLGMIEARVAGVPARIYRISFTGELSYEVHVPAPYGRAVWEALFEAGEPFGITPYGTEAMHVLRAEKGYIIIGQETDGTVSPFDLGLEWAIAKSKPDFVGKRSLARPEALRSDRKNLVGLVPLDGKTIVEEGAQLTAIPRGAPPVAMLGHVTSSYWSEAAGGPIALALVKGGRLRHGETIHARYGARSVACRIGPPIFYDPDGGRMHV